MKGDSKESKKEEHKSFETLFCDKLILIYTHPLMA